MTTAYPFDPSGTSSANRITNEQHVITAQNFRDYHYVVPNFAPFFEDNMVITLQPPSGPASTLALGIDYYFSNQFLDASRACAKPIYGSISFLDTDTAGVLTISYNTVGGMWTVSATEISRILAEEMRNPRITTWEQITYLPERFPVVEHEWDLVDMVGASSLVEAIDQVRAAVLATSEGGGITEHIVDFSNPHSVTKAQVGLGSVQDFPIASTLQAQAGTSNAFYMTPLRVKDAITTLAGAMIAAHADDVENPHGVTKEQVGLGSVQDFDVASQEQAELGAVDNVYMTPLKTAQAISALIGVAYAAHADNELNPHSVTKAQVGLGSVENYAIATEQEARDGLLNDKYMTPLRTSQLVSEFVTTQLDGHATRTDNPHTTTKAQVGLGNVQDYSTATQLQAQQGISNTAYMTPLRTLDAITALATPVAHMTNLANPHETTAAQVGAYTQTETDTLLAGYVQLTDLWVAGATKAAFIAEVLTGTAANASEVYGYDFNQLTLAAAESLYDDRYTHTVSFLSRDSAFTVDPVATPYRWILVGTVSTIDIVETGSINSIETTHPDAYWFFAGGHKQEATTALNAAAASSAYLIHAKNGLLNASHTFDVTRLNGTADSDVLFGWTYAADTLSVWVRVSYAHNDTQITRMTTLANEVALSSDLIVVEPADITYVDPVAYATAAALASLVTRVEALEAA